MPNGQEVLSRLSRTLQTFFGFGSVLLKDNGGAVQLRNEADTAFADLESNRLQVHGDNTTESVILDAPSGLSSSPVFTLPSLDGDSGQVIGTDGSGVLGFIDAGPGVFQIRTANFTQADTSPSSIFTPPTDDAVIRSTVIRVDVAATGGGNPTIKVGTSIDDEQYAETGQSNLKQVRTYEIANFLDVDTPPREILYQISLNGNGSSFSGKIFIVWFIEKT